MGKSSIRCGIGKPPGREIRRKRLRINTSANSHLRYPGAVVNVVAGQLVNVGRMIIGRMIKGEVAMKSSATPSAGARFLPLAVTFIVLVPRPTLASGRLLPRGGSERRLVGLSTHRVTQCFPAASITISYKADRIQGGPPATRMPRRLTRSIPIAMLGGWKRCKDSPVGLNHYRGVVGHRNCGSMEFRTRLMLSLPVAHRDDWGRGMPEDVVDVYDARFEKTARDIAKRLCRLAASTTSCWIL